jgi:UDP:flavonoid glycosyltransferase YjiC (YdhE family)
VKFTAITYGTEGDTRPLAALCRGLIDAGHDVTLLAASATLGSAQALGIPVKALAGDIRGLQQPGEALANVVRRGDRFADVTKALAHIANTNAESWMKAAADASEGCDAILLSALASFVGLSVAEYRTVPAIGLSLIPITPTSAFASPFLPPRWVPRFLNRASHEFVNAMLWRAFRKATNEARARVCDLPPRQTVWSGHPILYGVSPNLLPTPTDWPDNSRMCGQWLSTSLPWSPPAALEDFLRAGEPPIYIGFGSMMGIDHERLRGAIIAALAGRRALLYPGWSGMPTQDLPANIFVLGDTPHDWLLTRTSAVIHHGGSGTTHSAARAGVPAVIVPFAADQFFWAHRAKVLGVASALPAKSLTAAALARSIEFVARPEVRERARALGERMRGENGIATAVSAIDHLVHAWHQGR